ncbi:MAG: S8 family serine peptidase, partial [Saccharothrix sp.]|nr:S8 family serine peptidase [Saccharothrix sp.]
GPGRADVRFHTFHRDGDLHVVPDDALGALADGKLDLRLFDVTGLVEAGYDDAGRDTVPLIVTRRGDIRAGAAGTRVTRELPAIGAVAAQAAKSEAATAFRALTTDPDVVKVWLDGVRHPALDRSTAQIGAPTAWQAGYTGEGVKVAVLDGGVDGAHPDLAGREIAEENFTTDPDATDVDGHGTHVASIIAGDNTKYRGVAPGARILDGKVCVRYGCAESAILSGMQWAVDQGADIVNLSLGGTDTPEVDPLEEAVNTLSAQALFVIAAGNSYRPGTIGSPGSADAALTVGAVNRDDSIAEFSSRGPRIGDSGVKPDVTAPGVDIVAAKAATGTIGTPVDENHVALSGTSMATPHVAGAAAIIAQQHPDWTGAQIKATLMASAAPSAALTAFDQGTGRIDLAKALTTTVTAQPTSLAMGLQQWPHTDDSPVTKTLTYHNTGAEPATLDLTVDTDAPTGLFTVTPASITIPAGGQATATVTADTRIGTTDGAFSGTIKAGDTLRTPVSVEREAESYEFSATFLDANGQAPRAYSALLMGVDNGHFGFLEDNDNTVTTRLPKGEYLVYADVMTGTPEDGRLAVLAQPSLSLTGNVSTTFDARTAQPLEVTAPDPGATALIGDIGIDRTSGNRRIGFGAVFLGGFGEDLSVGHVGPTLPDDQLEVLVGAQFTGTPAGDAPVTYRFAWSLRGAVPTGFVRAPTRRELAEIRTTFGPGPADHQYLHGGLSSTPSGSGGWSALLPVRAGGSAVDRVTAVGVEWTWVFRQRRGAVELVADYSSATRAYRPGQRAEWSVNSPVFGPGLPSAVSFALARLDDEILVSVPLLNDSANNLGGSAYESGRTTLYRDGVKLDEFPQPVGQFSVPAGAADYRAEVDFVRAEGISEFATRVTGAWTFRSESVTGPQPRALPLSVVRFSPRLDADGGTPAGRVLRVPLTVEQQRGADNGRVREVRVEVSFDDGKTWARVPVAGGAALVRNADRAGFASLRAKGSDSKGNTFEHTVIRAYKIG